jgi:hypothetical protein
MRRASSKQSVPADMYRHFAAITLVATTLLAIFSNGERSEAIADQVKANQHKKEVSRARSERRRAGTENFDVGKGRMIDHSVPVTGPSDPDRPTSDNDSWSAPPPQAWTPERAAEFRADAGVRPESPVIGPDGALIPSGNSASTSPQRRKLTKKELKRMIEATRNMPEGGVKVRSSILGSGQAPD